MVDHFEVALDSIVLFNLSLKPKQVTSLDLLVGLIKESNVLSVRFKDLIVGTGVKIILD